MTIQIKTPAPAAQRALLFLAAASFAALIGFSQYEMLSPALIGMALALFAALAGILIFKRTTAASRAVDETATLQKNETPEAPKACPKSFHGYFYDRDSREDLDFSLDIRL